MMAKTIYIKILTLLMATLAFSCAEKDLPYTDDSSREGGMSEMTLEFDVNTLQPGIRTRATGDDVKSLWVGVYDITTGNRIGYNPKKDNSEEDNSKEDVSIPKTVQVIYYDAHPTVVVVGVANYVGVTNNNQESLQDLLNAAETWEDFRNIDIDVTNISDDAPLMMGYVGSNKNNPTIGLGDDGSVFIDGRSAENSDYEVKLISKDIDDSNYFKEEIKRNIGDIQLVPLISTINVKVEAGKNIEISDISYKRGNLPQAVYLAERPTHIGGRSGDDIRNGSSNYADQFVKSENSEPAICDPNFYSSDNEWINIEDPSFKFNQYENKHWGLRYNNEEILNSFNTIYQKREAKSTDGILYSLCGTNNLGYNNFASYFIVKMKVVDKNTGSSGVVEYTIHEGNCNDKDGNSSLNSPQDFSCFRNMNYTYKLKIEGVNRIEIYVDREDGVHNAGISGTVYSMKQEDLESLNFNKDLNKEGWQFRFYVSPAYDEQNTQALDYVTNEEMKGLEGFYWPEFSNENSKLSDFDKYIHISKEGEKYSSLE